MPIKRIHARQIFDSRGNPTIEVDVTTNLGLFRAAVPSGASTGTYEALELRDGDKNKYHGKSVYKAISNINDILRPKIIAKNFEVTQQKEIDNFMIALDGTDFKSNLGANSILGISIAVAKAGAAKKGVPLYRHLADLAGNRNFILPVPGFNVINGGQHAGNRMAVQDEVYHHLLAVIKRKYGLDATCVGDEGGFAPNITDAGEALELINQSIKLAGLVGKVEIAIDSAASEMYKEGLYDLDFKNVKSEKAKWLTPTSLIDFYKKLIADYPIVSLEDPLNQDDEWDTWAQKSGSLAVLSTTRICSLKVPEATSRTSSTFLFEGSLITDEPEVPDLTRPMKVGRFTARLLPTARPEPAPVADTALYGTADQSSMSSQRYFSFFGLVSSWYCVTADERPFSTVRQWPSRSETMPTCCESTGRQMKRAPPSAPNPAKTACFSFSDRSLYSLAVH
ncbi:Enol-1p [Tyrophagus putrescentiae]|nr:Enol-1p [Tyrophagus putrescentiae]